MTLAGLMAQWWDDAQHDIARCRGVRLLMARAYGCTWLEAWRLTR